jgi:exopolysaccharide biosynthesis polyprenyl glycosylphosphotransferase
VLERGYSSDHATWPTRYLRILVFIDLVCALAAGGVGLGVRFGPGPGTPLGDLALVFSLPVLWLCWLAGSGAYDRRFFGAGSDEYRRVMSAGVSLTAAVAIASYAAKAELARGLVVMTLPLLVLLDLVCRFAMRKRLHTQRARGAHMRRVVAVGHRAGLADLVKELGRSQYHGMQVVAACAPPGGESMINQVPVLGGLDEVVEVVLDAKADAVAVLACPEYDGLALRRLAWQLERTATDMFVAPALLDVAGPRTTIRPIAGLPLLHVDHPDLEGPKRVFKAAFDKVVAGTVLALLGPLMAVVALMIKMHDKGPVLFVQVRTGRDGREFRMLKFRTMVIGADQLKAELAEQNQGHGALFKMRDDPRVTPVGRWLRRYSLDELPQLINVLRGDMSLIGPRPPLPEEVRTYAQDVSRKLVVKPGLTGLWQVSGRSDLPWEEAVRLDIWYVENWSLVLDMQILWKTVHAVISASGAY